MSAPTPFADRPLAYLAGPFTKPDPHANTHRAIRLADIAMRRMDVTVHVPHLTGLWHTVAPKPHEHWLAYDLALLGRCDLVWRIPGESAGATAEVEYARERGIDVVHSLDEMRDWLTGWLETERRTLGAIARALELVGPDDEDYVAGPALSATHPHGTGAP